VHARSTVSTSSMLRAVRGQQHVVVFGTVPPPATSATLDVT